MNTTTSKEGTYDFMELKRWCVLKGKQQQKLQKWSEVPDDGFGIQDAIEGIENGETVEQLERWHDQHKG